MRRACVLLAAISLAPAAFANFEVRIANAAAAAGQPIVLSQDAFQTGLSYYRRALRDGQFAMAAHHFRLAAQQDDPAASLALAYLLAAGKGVEANRLHAEQWLDRLPPPLLARGAYVRGLLALTHGDAQVAARESIAWWECAASMGDTLARHRLATVRERARAYAEAQRLYAQADADGLPVADINATRLARAKAETLTVAKLARLRQRTRAGDAAAAFELARAHHRGSLMPINITAALQLYQRAARGGHEDAARMAQLLLQNRQRQQRLDYAWIARLAWTEPQARSNLLLPSAARQVIQQEHDPLWQLETLMKRHAAAPLCARYAQQAANVAPR
jgi:TPR repeat protein